MHIQFVGVDNSRASRTYTFHVIDLPHESRQFTVQVRSEEFRPGRLSFQDGPGISSERLQRELMAESQESLAQAELCIEAMDVQAYRAEHYPPKKVPTAPDRSPGLSHEPPPPGMHSQNRGYWPLGPTRHSLSEEIFILLLHELGTSLDGLKLALEGQSVRVVCATSCQETLPLLTGPNPPHLVFTQPTLPDGNWADVVGMALKACKPVNVIIVGRLANVGLYLQTVSGGAFDFIVPPLTGYELTHVLRCAIENVLTRREAQARSA